MKLLGDYIKSRRGVLLFFALAAALLVVSFALFHLPLRAVAYPCALALLLGLAALALDFRRVYKLHRELSQLETTASELIGVLPAAASVPETDYQAIVQSLCRQSADAAAKAAAGSRVSTMLHASRMPSNRFFMVIPHFLPIWCAYQEYSIKKDRLQ